MGREEDLFIVVYLDNLLNDPNDIADSLLDHFPEALPFRPRNAMSVASGTVWLGESYTADSPASKLI